MTQEEKELLLKDLCERLPYGVKVKTPYNDAILRGIVDRKGVKTTIDYTDIVTDKQTYPIRYIKPYLRPMSSMTEEEKEEYCQLQQRVIYNSKGVINEDVTKYINWCYKKHLDINNLIPMELAIDATGLNIY